MSIHSEALKEEILNLTHQESATALIALVNALEELGGKGYLSMDAVDNLIDLTKKANRK